MQGVKGWYFFERPTNFKVPLQKTTFNLKKRSANCERNTFFFNHNKWTFSENCVSCKQFFRDSFLFTFGVSSTISDDWSIITWHSADKGFRTVNNNNNNNKTHFKKWPQGSESEDEPLVDISHSWRTLFWCKILKREGKRQCQNGKHHFLWFRNACS